MLLYQGHRGPHFADATVRTMVYFASLFWTLAGACRRRRSRLRILSVIRPILLHDIESQELKASIGLRRSTIVVVGSWGLKQDSSAGGCSSAQSSQIFAVSIHATKS